MWNLNYVIRDVDDMYNYAKTNSITLLPSGLTYDFWDEYEDNSAQYDRLFRRLYINYKYFDQNISDDNPVSRVLTDFKEAVEDLFLMNHDKYDELYKIKVASLEMEISPFNDYQMSENEIGSNGYTRDYSSGARQDNNSKTTPPLSETRLNEKYAYNSTQFIDDTKTTITNPGFIETSQFDKGAQFDLEHKTGNLTNSKSTTGVRNSPYENLAKANKYWDNYDLYKKIFDDICRAYLLVK